MALRLCSLTGLSFHVFIFCSDGLLDTVWPYVKLQAYETFQRDIELH